MDAELRAVKVEHGVAVHDLPAKGVVAAHGVDLLPGVFGHVRHLVEHRAAAQGEVPPADVQAGEQQVAARGGLGEVDDLAHVPGVDVRPDQQQAGLRQAPAALVHGDRGHVRPRGHRGDRKAAAKVKVGAVRLVRQAQHPGAVGHLHDGAQVAAHAVVGGVVDQDGHGLRVLGDGLGHLLAPHPQGDAQPLVDLRVHIDRHGPAEHQRVDDAPVHVAGQDDLVPALAGRKHHALHGAGRPAHHEEGVGRAKGVGRQLLRLVDDGDGVAEVVQGLHAVDVHAHALLPEERRQLRVAPAMLVAGHVKGHHPHAPEVFQRFIDGGAPLVQLHSTVLQFHSLLSATTQQKTRKPCSCTTCAFLLNKLPALAAWRRPAQRRPPPQGTGGGIAAGRDSVSSGTG